MPKPPQTPPWKRGELEFKVPPNLPETPQTSPLEKGGIRVQSPPKTPQKPPVHGQGCFIL
ncbi:MAG TPA: hypothetical protein DDZ60_00350 [Planktothrix sp. UBA10369]|nr:hypothetical protein [Planktothrix sp. UBA10369]